ncbi:MAG: PhoU-like phosphate transport system protein [Propionibacteriaceae bacterium]|nr:PhoU-like phosphate transport system protein [Propionibacteriaceae bacterium]
MIQPEVGRLEFASDLRMVRASLVTMTKTASKAIRAATTALLDLDQEAVRMTASLEQELEDDMVEIERRTHHLLARQQPVAGDLRMLVSALKISADCRRMGALANHISTAASRCYPAPAIPDELSEIFRRMDDVASRIADGARITLTTSDALDAARLEIDDDAMDGLLRTLFRALVDNWSHGVEAAVNVALIGRYYERFADHAVGIAQSVIFIETAMRPHVGAPHVG